jgi:predicted nuclease with TOPRIM domain
MTRDQVRNIISGITDEQLQQILDINSADIGKAKEPIASLQQQLTAANNTISELNKNKGDVDALQKKIDEYEQEKTNRENAEKEAQKDAAYMARFDKLHGDRKYTNDFTKNGVFAEFKEALGKPENEGKSDADIFASLTKDRDGIFTNPNPGVDIPGMGDSETVDKAAYNAVRTAAGLKPI